MIVRQSPERFLLARLLCADTHVGDASQLVAMSDRRRMRSQPAPLGTDCLVSVRPPPSASTMQIQSRHQSIPPCACVYFPFSSRDRPSSQHHLSGVAAEDVGVTGVKDGHGRAAEELTACSAELNLQITYSQSHVGSLQSVPYKEHFFSGL